MKKWKLIFLSVFVTTIVFSTFATMEIIQRNTTSNDDVQLDISAYKMSSGEKWTYYNGTHYISYSVYSVNDPGGVFAHKYINGTQVDTSGVGIAWYTSEGLVFTYDLMETLKTGAGGTTTETYGGQVRTVVNSSSGNTVVVYDYAKGFILEKRTSSTRFLLVSWGLYDETTWTDTDQDGLSDIVETLYHGTNSTDSDSDDDGYSDGAEVLAGTDPLDATSKPADEIPGFSWIFTLIAIIGALVYLIALRKPFSRVTS